jgi:hypothetical protein
MRGMSFGSDGVFDIKIRFRRRYASSFPQGILLAGRTLRENRCSGINPEVRLATIPDFLHYLWQFADAKFAKLDRGTFALQT